MRLSIVGIALTAVAGEAPLPPAMPLLADYSERWAELVAPRPPPPSMPDRCEAATVPRTRVRLQTQNCKNMLSLLYELLRTVVAPLEPRCVGFAFGRFEALLFRCSEGLH